MICSVLGLELEEVNIGQEGRVMGRLKMPPVNLRGKGADAAKPHLIVGFAGPRAEHGVNSDFANYNGGSSDEIRAGELAVAALFGGGESVEESELTEEEKRQALALLKEADEAATQLVKKYWLPILRVAELLMTYATLSGAEVATIIALENSRRDVSGEAAALES